MNQAKKIALGGILASLAIVIMCLGGLIPVATFVCPMACIILLCVVARLCGSRIAWAWFGVVEILSALLGPDKEAAAVFAFLGYYPIIKPRLDRMKAPVLWKLLLFNTTIGIMYTMLIYLFGLAQIAEEHEALDTIMMIVILVVGNVTFFLLDLVLGRLKFN